MDFHIGEVMAQELLEDCDRDDQWMFKFEHRFQGVCAIMRSDDYIWVRCCVSNERMPCPPDPSDRGISKRAWEKQMTRWRRALSLIRRHIGSSMQ